MPVAIDRLRPLLQDPGVLKIGHDVKTAAHLLSRYGIELAPYDCTMLMSYVLDGGQAEHTIENLVRRSFAHELKPLKVEASTVGRALTDEEQSALLGSALRRPESQRLRCAIVLALNTTMRSVELKHLRWRDVDLLERIVTVRRSKTEAGKREIPLNDEAFAALRELRE